MDDVLIASYTENEHLDHISQVFKCFHKFIMKLKLAKCEFGRSEIQFLGHITMKALGQYLKKQRKYQRSKHPEMPMKYVHSLEY